MLIFDFKHESNLAGWMIVDDVILGGRSNGKFSISNDGHGLFSGKVSLENNGGFSSVRHRFEKKEVNDYKKVTIRLKGDGKRYQFRIKSDKYDRYSYVSYLQTDDDWQTIEIPFSEMYPSFRGMRLKMSNYPGKLMEELAFLIGNGEEESFKLEIDKISLE